MRFISHCTSSSLRFHPFNWASAQFERQHPLRICPACVIADHDQIGYAYWHLGHQLPGVWVCPDHGEALHLAAPGKTQSSWVLPSLVGSSKPSGLNRSERELLKYLADVVNQLCSDQSADLASLREQICQYLEQAGVTQASRALNAPKVNRWLSSHLGRLPQTHFQTFDAASKCECIVGALGKRKSHHPLRWAILMACLRKEGAPLEGMLRALDGPAQPALPGFPMQRVPTAPSHAYTFMRSGEDIVKVAQAAGVTRAVVQRWLMDPQLHALWTSTRLEQLRTKHIRPNHHLLCIEALFGAQRPFFQQLRLLGMGQEPSRDLQSRLSSGNDGSGLVHREIFLHGLQANGRDVMLHLEERYPFTHSWILKHALPWSRRKIAELVPPSPDRKSILRAAARDRQSEEAAVRERQRRAMSAIGGQPTQTDVPANSSKSAEHVFHGMSKLLPRASWVSPATRRSNG